MAKGYVTLQINIVNIIGRENDIWLKAIGLFAWSVMMIANSVYQAVNFYFHLLLQNHWANFNQTLQKHPWVKEVSSNRKGLLNCKNSLNNLKVPLSWNTGSISINWGQKTYAEGKYRRHHFQGEIIAKLYLQPLDQFQPNFAKSSRRWETKSLYKCIYNQIFTRAC